MAKARKFSRTKNCASVKVSNKNYNRQVKSGKIKPNTNWNSKRKPVNKLRNAGSLSKSYNGSNENFNSSDVEDMLDNDIGSTDINSAKRKREDDDNETEGVQHYEVLPRQNNFRAKRFKQLLPLKNKQGLIPQEVELLEQTQTNTSELYPIPSSFLENVTLPENTASFMELCVARENRLEECKERIGLLCSSVVENPEENIRKLKEVLACLDENDPDLFLSVRKIASLSLVEVFKDIVPSYRIRGGPGTDKQTKLKKETRILREYEDSLLRYYKQFLFKLEKMLEFLKSKRKLSPELVSQAKLKARHSVAVIAVKCLSELLVAHPHFNFSSNILKVIVDKMAHKDTDISSVCCETMERVFKNDKVGGTSLEGVKLIKKLVKSRNFIIPPPVLFTFLPLNVKEAERTDDKNAKDSKNSKKQLMSRREKKRSKKLKEVENELLEAEAEESVKKKSKLHTEILNQVFLIYFQILKGKNTRDVLSPVLEGLSKFSHLINVDYFDDLITVLNKLIESGSLGYREILHCLVSVFTILSGQGDSLNIDPQGFYTHLYKCLLEVHFDLPEEDVILFLKCLDLMIMQRRKKITLQRVLAFLKRLSTIALSQKSHVTLALMAIIRQYFLNFRQSDILLDPENSSSGQYKPDLEDPEYCSANTSVLWELHQLTQNHHPVVAKYAQHLLLHCPTSGTGQLHSFLALKSPLEMLKLFNEDKKTIHFKNPVKPGKSSTKFHPRKCHPCVTATNSITSQALSLIKA